jgi:hypothetical protein
MLSATYASGVLTLDDDHVYRLGSRVLPGNTQILKDMGIIDTAYYNMDAAWRGTKVHEATALYDEYNGDFHWPSVDSRYVGYVRGWEKFVRETGFKADIIERPVLGVGATYATTVDRVGIVGGKCVVLEIKTGTCPKWVGLQTAMQLEACLAQGLLKSADRMAVELSADGKYRIVRCENPSDSRKAMALAIAWHVRKEYRGDSPW